MSRKAPDRSLSSPAFPTHDRCWHDSRWRARVRTRLLNWFDHNARTLPWRSEPTPYRVWVSEIMLQQTQVATVIPYFERFLTTYPTIASLAAADEQSLLGLWEGLGYYRRARSLHAAARQIVDQHGGEFPDTYKDVLALPGVGRYTAGAILSIARDVPLPVLEGNTQRVFSRWTALRGAPNDNSTQSLLWEIATAMLPRRQAGTFNQAAMELGALICTPKAPRCPQCPVRNYCRAHRDGLQDVVPGKVSKVVYQPRTEFAMVIRETDAAPPRFLIRPLPEGGRWAGLWDFPRTMKQSIDTVGDAAQQLHSELQLPVVPGIRLATIKHAVTRYRIALHVHQATMHSDWQPSDQWKFVDLHSMASLPMSVTGRRIVRLIADNRQSQPASC